MTLGKSLGKVNRTTHLLYIFSFFIRLKIVYPDKETSSDSTTTSVVHKINSDPTGLVKLKAIQTVENIPAKLRIDVNL
jgi:hypothetical protein